MSSRTCSRIVRNPRAPVLRASALCAIAVSVVQGDRFDVIGGGYVAINDVHKAVSPAGKFYLLAPGDRFDLVKREGSRRAEDFKPLERVAPRKPS